MSFLIVDSLQIARKIRFISHEKLLQIADYFQIAWKIRFIMQERKFFLELHYTFQLNRKLFSPHIALKLAVNEKKSYWKYVSYIALKNYMLAISILPSISKIFERILYSRLISYISEVVQLVFTYSKNCLIDKMTHYYIYTYDCH